MRTRSAYAVVASRVALGLALSLTAGACKGKAPVPTVVAQEEITAEPAPKPEEQRLPGFVLGDPAGEPEPAAAPAAPPSVAPVAAPTLNGDPNGLSRNALNMAVQRAMGRLAGCFSPSARNPTVTVSFEAEPVGRPSLLRISGSPPEAEPCLRDIMQGIRFPSFEGKAVHVELPLTFQQVGFAQPAAPAPAPAQAPPLNIEP